MFEISGVGIVAAFLGGTISFLSPCVLPLAPGYVSYIAGQPAVKSGAARSIAERARSVILSLWFVFGFSTVFVALGAGASLLGGMLLRWKYELGLAGGVLIVLFGLVMMGAIKIPAMMRDTRPDVKVDGGSASRSLPFGPCLCLWLDALHRPCTRVDPGSERDIWSGRDGLAGNLLRRTWTAVSDHSALHQLDCRQAQEDRCCWSMALSYIGRSDGADGYRRDDRSDQPPCLLAARNLPGPWHDRIKS